MLNPIAAARQSPPPATQSSDSEKSSDEEEVSAFQKQCRVVAGEPVTPERAPVAACHDMAPEPRTATPLVEASAPQAISDEDLFLAFRSGLTSEQVKAYFPLPDQPQSSELSIDKLEVLLHRSQAGGHQAVSCELRANVRQVLEGLVECLQHLLRQQIPEHFPDMSQLPQEYSLDLIVMLRNIFTLHLNMWGVVDQCWAKDLAAEIGDMKCHEIFAGSGWLTKALSAQGVNISASDINPKNPVTDVQTKDAVTAVKSSDFDCLILSWPHPDAAEAMKEAIRALKPGKKIIYVGHREPDRHEIGYIATPQGMAEVELIKVMTKPKWALCDEDVYFLERK